MIPLYTTYEDRLELFRLLGKIQAGKISAEDKQSARELSERLAEDKQ